jgi:hypothetical protein
VLAYLSRYTHRVAISNSRLLSSKIAPTWRAAARAGKNIRQGLILPVSSSSMKVCCRGTEGVHHELTP